MCLHASGRAFIFLRNCHVNIALHLTGVASDDARSVPGHRTEPEKAMRTVVSSATFPIGVLHIYTVGNLQCVYLN